VLQIDQLSIVMIVWRITNIIMWMTHHTTCHLTMHNPSWTTWILPLMALVLMN